MAVQRRLAAILAADVAGYSRLMGEDEEGTLAALTAHRTELIEPCIAEYRGRIVKTTGDGLLAEFASVVDAVRCAVAFQVGMAERNRDVAENNKCIRFRIGVNLGDVIVQDEDVFGDGVNIASRLEGLAEPGGICLSGSAHEHVRDKLDISFTDIGEQRLKNIDRPVRAFSLAPATGAGTNADAAPNPAPPPSLPDKPSIAVLPFDNLSGDPEQAYFSDGMAEDIITALSRLRHLFVIARNTTFTYKGRAVDVQAVAEELGVRYVLEGSVRKAGNRVRVTAQLIDGQSGQHLWADRYDREIEDIFHVQDEISDAVTREVSTELDRAEGARARSQAPENLDAWSALQKGISLFGESQLASFGEAEAMFTQSIELDPNFALAHAWLSLNYNRQGTLGFREFKERDAFQAAQRAIELDRQEPLGHFALGWCQYSVNRFDLAVEALEHALGLNSNLGLCRMMLARTLASQGRHEEAVAQFELSVQLSPRDDLVEVSYGGKAFSLLALKDYEGAVEWGRRAMQSPRTRFAPSVVVSALGHAGKVEQAKIALAEMGRLRPDFTYSYLRDNLPALKGDDLQFYLDGLQKAGLPKV